MNLKQNIWALVALFCTIGPSFAQIPGDGVPDLYYFPTDGLVAQTTAGPVSLPAGMTTLDTDGNDMIVTNITGPDATCIPRADGRDPGICEGSVLPKGPTTAATFTMGFINGQTQLVRVNPLIGDGFEGVVGVQYIDDFGMAQDWPDDVVVGDAIFFDYPDVGFFQYEPGLTEDDLLDFTFAGESPSIFFDSLPVTIVPEPSSDLLLSWLIAGLAMHRRR